MAQSKKRPQHITKMLADINNTLRVNKIKETSDHLFIWAVDYLLHNGYYKGYNFYIDSEFNKDIPTLAGSSTNYEYLQIL